MKLLAFETATEACSVALYIDGEVYERFDIVPKQHTQLALPWAEQLLADAGIKKSQLDAIAVGIGPGAFTGVRLAVALVQGIALALDKPVLPVSTLAALAMQGADLKCDRILAAIDARMGEIYCAEFRLDKDNLVDAISEEIVIAPETYQSLFDGSMLGVGT
ncbi:MAG: tRNA (adenosine(37)-N6)-threonylcarbamoyltransferase complex dimerization subunit type 1 TsaB, partial [Arenimonas sp.]